MGRHSGDPKPGPMFIRGRHADEPVLDGGPLFSPRTRPRTGRVLAAVAGAAGLVLASVTAAVTMLDQPPAPVCYSGIPLPAENPELPAPQTFTTARVPVAGEGVRRPFRAPVRSPEARPGPTVTVTRTVRAVVTVRVTEVRTAMVTMTPLPRPSAVPSGGE